MRIIQANHPQEIKKIMQEIRVDPYGAKIMLPKALSYLVRISAVSNITANILKQEMLSLGGDVAVARGALTGKTKKTDCLVMGNLAQFFRLAAKLNKQPFGLNNLADELKELLKNYQKESFTLDLGRFKLNLGLRSYIMGIVNVTPDSFSGDGLYSRQPPAASRQSDIIEYARKLVRDGADIIDVGGESTRPGAMPVGLKEELKRTIPVIKNLSKKIKVPISIDTRKPEVAKQAFDNGAVMVNDVSGLRGPQMINVAARYKAGAVIMHMQGTPFNMQKSPKYLSLIDEIICYLKSQAEKAIDAGVSKDRILLDPGIGFGKTSQDNLKIISYLRDFKALGFPILIGTSRKSFIGKLLNVPPDERVFGSVASCVLAVKNGASIVRAHDVKQVKQALRIADAAN